ncbi:MAG: S1C family serine protease [Acetobacteraceae bacterium]
MLASLTPAPGRRNLAAIFAALAVSLVVPPPAEAAPMPGSFAPLVRQVLPAVVNIAVTSVVSNNGDIASLLPPALRGTPFERQFLQHFGTTEQVRAVGSGYVIAADGVIVTNNHVIENATRIVVSFHDGRTVTARVIGADPLTDIAVLKVDVGRSLPFVRFGDSNAVEVGDWVLAAGDPFALGATVTAGIVSAKDREIGDGPFDRFLQLDAAINPGNSGGPLFNLKGEVIGMNTAIVAPGGGSVGIGFAIPSDTVSRIVAELRAGGRIRRGWLGVAVGSLAGQDAAATGIAANGVLVNAVVPGGPASRAGLRPGDVVLAVTSTPVADPEAMIRAVASIRPGRRVRLLISRGGRRFDLPVTIGERPANQPG